MLFLLMILVTSLLHTFPKHGPVNEMSNMAKYHLVTVKWGIIVINAQLQSIKHI